jgi:hypothetical protein
LPANIPKKFYRTEFNHYLENLKNINTGVVNYYALYLECLKKQDEFLEFYKVGIRRNEKETM